MYPNNPFYPYYNNQVGTGLPAFEGVRYQRGSGVFGRIFSSIAPFVKQLLPALGKKILPSAVGFAQDVISGENVKSSALSRLKEAGTNVADVTLEQLKTRLQQQKGSGRRKRRRSRSKIRSRSRSVSKNRKASNKSYKKHRKRRRKSQNTPSYLL